MRPLLRILLISRPALWINTLGPALLGLWSTGVLWNPQALWMFLWLSLPFNLLIYGVNDIFDWQTDQSNPRKGGWQGARLERSEFKQVGLWVVCLNFPFLWGFVYGGESGFLWSIAVYLSVFLLYSIPPVRLKAIPFLDSLSNAAYGLPVVIMPLFLGHRPPWNLFFLLACWSVAKHAYDSIQDMEVDRKAGVGTIATSLGLRKTLIWSSIWWAMSSWLMWQMSILLTFCNLLYCATLVGALWKNPSVRTAQKLYQASVLFPYFVGTLGGIMLALSVWWKIH